MLITYIADWLPTFFSDKELMTEGMSASSVNFSQPAR